MVSWDRPTGMELTTQRMVLVRLPMEALIIISIRPLLPGGRQEPGFYPLSQWFVEAAQSRGSVVTFLLLPHTLTYFPADFLLSMVYINLVSLESVLTKSR